MGPFGAGNFLPKPPSDALEPFLKKSNDEVKAQQLLEQLSSLSPDLPTDVGDLILNTNTKENANGVNLENVDLEQLAWVSKALRENLPKYGPQVGGLGAKFTSSVLSKISDSIEQALDESKDSNTIDDQIIRASARGVANAANQGAYVLKDTQ